MYGEHENNPSFTLRQPAKTQTQPQPVWSFADISMNQFPSAPNQQQPQQQQQFSQHPQQQQQFLQQSQQQQQLLQPPPQQQQQFLQPTAVIQTAQNGYTNTSLSWIPPRNIGGCCSPLTLTRVSIILHLIGAILLLILCVILLFVLGPDETIQRGDRLNHQQTASAGSVQWRVVHGVLGLLLGLSIVLIPVYTTILRGVARENLSLIVFWIVLLGMEIIFQVFIIIISFALVLQPEVPGGKAGSALFQSMVLLVFNIVCLKSATAFCKEINFKKFQRHFQRQANSGTPI